jgi:hypothetical protein
MRRYVIAGALAMSNPRSRFTLRHLIGLVVLCGLFAALLRTPAVPWIVGIALAVLYVVAGHAGGEREIPGGPTGGCLLLLFYVLTLYLCYHLFFLLLPDNS